jgi:transposase
VDETSIGKGHNYLTVVLNGINGEVLHIAEGKRKTSLESFFQKLTPEQKASIQSVGIDRKRPLNPIILITA